MVSPYVQSEGNRELDLKSETKEHRQKNLSLVMLECSSAGEHPLHTGRVVGSIPITPTIFTN